MNATTKETNNKVRQFEQVLQIIERYNYDKSRLITILQQVQEAYRYLPQQVLTYIATALNMPVAEVYGVATFYAHFSLEAKGKYVAKVCNGTACHVKGAIKLKEAFYKKLKMAAEKHTTDDMMFTVELVSCLGACGLAPVLTINEKVYGPIDAKKTEALIDTIIKEDASPEAGS